MGWKFNPFTGALDQTGSGGGGGASYIDGEVATYNDLPLDGTAALDSAWLVRSASGVWLVSRKQAGIYIRTATAGSSRDADYTYAGTMPDVFSDANFTLYDDASTTRTGQFNLGSITAGQNRVLTWPDGNGTIARISDIPTAVTSVSGTAPIVSSGGTTPAISIQNNPTLTGDVIINGATTGASGTLKVGSTTGSFTRDVELSDQGIVLRNSGSSGTTTIARGTGGTSNYTLTPPAASGTLMLNNIGSTSGLPVVTTTAGAITTLALGAANTVLKVNSGGTAVEFGAAGGVTSGSVDNAVLRADGTGGSTSQSSDINIEDATTSTANNVTISNQHSGQTNSSLVLQAKGTGSLLAQKPTGTSTGGNARGDNAVDWQMSRSTQTQVASGATSVVLGGQRNTASSTDAIAGGYQCTASGAGSIAISRAATASGTYSVAVGGNNHTASQTYAAVFGGVTNVASATYASVFAGNDSTASAEGASCIGASNALANRYYMQAHSAGVFAAQGDAQRARFVLRCKTTTNAAVEMGLNGSTTYLTIPSGKVIYTEIRIVGTKSDGSAVACYTRQYAAKNVGGTSSEVFAPVTIGTDNAAGTSLEVATVDAGDYIRIRPTGIASEVWRWVASVDAVEVAYGT